jgi:HEAT repeat protein
MAADNTTNDLPRRLLYALRAADDSILKALWPELQESQDRAVFEVLHRTARNDRSVVARQRAVRVLGALEYPEALDDLHFALGEREAVVRQEAARALGKFKYAHSIDDLSQAMRHDSDERVRAAAARALGQIGHGNAVAPLLRALQYEPALPVCQAIVMSLASLPTGYYAAIPELAQIALDEQREAALRQTVIAALGHMGDSSVIPILLKTLYDRNAAICKAGALALENIEGLQIVHVNDRTIITSLRRTLRRSTDPDVRRITARFLGYIQDPDAIPELLQALNDNDASVSQEAGLALGKFGIAAEYGLIDTLLRNPNPSSRIAAASGLGLIGTDNAVDALGQALDDSYVRRTAWKALSQIPTARAKYILSQQPLLRKLWFGLTG